MQILKSFNLLMCFLAELMMVASLGYIGFHTYSHPFGKYLTGLGLPLLAIILWGIFAAPRSAYRLESPFRTLFALVLFGITALLLYRYDQVGIAITFGSIALLSQLLALVLKQ